MIPQFNLNKKSDVIKIAVLITATFGILTSVFFMVIETDSYSAIYIVPNSIIHNSGENTVLYQYGVKSFESSRMDYTLYTYVDATLVKTKQFSLNNGEILDETDKIILPYGTQYPSKISLKLTTNTATEEVHFWIK